MYNGYGLIMANKVRTPQAEFLYQQWILIELDKLIDKQIKEEEE